jgi:hypothetical protein
MTNGLLKNSPQFSGTDEDDRRLIRNGEKK